MTKEQEFRLCGDGSVLVPGAVPDAGRLRGWILGFGNQAEVRGLLERGREIGKK
ncbi:MAG: WYL domain-containing protein [Deltaproteobacteria bacterium]|nr:WYL domain-containing protein [Deltaproteobacteria bacterium]